MKRLLAMAALPVLIVGIVVASGCTTTTKIADIKNNASYWTGKDVTVKGEVGDSFWIALLTKGAYQINDGSASIWVVTGQQPPEKGAEVTVSGKVENAISVGDQALGTVVAEAKRK